MSAVKDITYAVALSTYLSWMVLFPIGYIRDFLARLLWGGVHDEEREGDKPGYAPIKQDRADFFTRRVYYRVVECFNRPVAGPPDRVINVVIRAPCHLRQPEATGEHRVCVNLGSYNYLGFANQVRCPLPCLFHCIGMAAAAVW
jgi:serine palmitoyltransferase